MVRLGGESMDEVDERGERVVDDTFVLLLNADAEPHTFRLPAHRPDLQWERVLDTGEAEWGQLRALRGHTYRLPDRALAVFRTRRRG